MIFERIVDGPWGRIFDGVKYIHLFNDNEFKKKSLYDNVYFTLRDIVANAESPDTIMTANDFNHCLTGGICFEDRTERFQYSNELHQKYFVEKLKSWLKKFKPNYLGFVEPYEDEQIDMKEYMKFDDWWVQFINLRKLIDEQYEKCCKWEEEDIGRDCDRLEELAYDQGDEALADECYARGVDPIFGEEIIEGGPGLYPEDA